MTGIWENTLILVVEMHPSVPLKAMAVAPVFVFLYEHLSILHQYLTFLL